MLSGPRDPSHKAYVEEKARVALKIAPSVREDLVSLLFHPAMRGVGYSEFVDRAIKQTHREIKLLEEREQRSKSNKISPEATP